MSRSCFRYHRSAYISTKETMTFTFKCYQNNFMINNLNIVSFGDCFGSIIACMAFALLIELNRGIDLYLRNYLVHHRTNNSLRELDNLSERKIQRRRLLLHVLRTIVHLVQTGLSYIMMLMVMHNFAGFFISAIIALGIGYYLLNGVHPYSRSVNHAHISHTNSDLTDSIDLVNDDPRQSQTESRTTSSYQRLTTSINSS